MSTRFESGSLSSIVNSSDLVTGSREFVRIIIRRPHAYEFIKNHAPSDTQSFRGSPAGVTLGDGSHFPIPGIYFLDAKNKILEKFGLFDAEAKTKIAKAMSTLGSL